MKEIQGKWTLVQVSKGSSNQELTVGSGLKNRAVYLYIQLSAAVSVKIRKSGPLWVTFQSLENPSMEFALVQLFSTKKAIFSCKKVAIVALLFFFSFLTDFDDLFDDDDLQWSKKHFKILLYSLLGLKYVLNIVCKLRPDYLTFIWFVQLYFHYTGNKKSWFIN